VPLATAIIFTWLVWAEAITVFTGTWSLQTYISTAYGRLAPVSVRAASKRLRSSAGRDALSPSNATITRSGASSLPLSRLSAPGTSASVFQRQEMAAGTAAGVLKYET